MNRVHDGDPAVDGASELPAIDLNLVAAFDALARERNVTRAAERMGVTQSAMSHALRRLRDRLGDPLFVRGRDGMALTPRAALLVTPLRGALVTVARALREPTPFAPATAVRTFTLATPDLFDLVVIPPLLERTASEAPHVDIVVGPVDRERLATQLETGEIDVAIVPQVEGTGLDARAGIVRRTLFHDAFTCFLRARHPALRGKTKKRLHLATYAALPHALVSPTGAGRGLVDDVLAAHGLRRRVALRVPHFLSALAIVARSDLVLTAPSTLARLASKEHAVVSLPPPVALPKHAIVAIWHERFGEDPGHRWFRDRVAAVARAAVTPPSRA